MFQFHLVFNTKNDVKLDPFEINPIILKEEQNWKTGEITMVQFMKATFETTSEKPLTGSLHLYREASPTNEQELFMNSDVLAVLAVPLYMTPQDFLKLMGSQRNDLLHVVVLYDQIPNRFMILLKFKTAESATLFYKDFNGKPFNSFEAETCHIVHIKSIFVSQPLPWSERILEGPVASTSSLKLIELPTCPVCLERMDSAVTGLLTTLCQHTFHCHCIMRWGDTTCPVCRYSSTQIESQDNNCSVCLSTQNLWICLICANVGCGRYVKAHASEHFQDTGHVYSLELETQRVWDYKGDGYVHRLIQDNDGKLVQLPAPSESPNPRFGLDMYDPESLVCPEDVRVAEKIEHMTQQFQSLSTSQQREQTEIFDQKLQKTELNAVDVVSQLESRICDLEQQNNRLRHERDKFAQLAQENQSLYTKQQKMNQKYVQKLDLAEKRFREEHSLNQSLRVNQTLLKQESTIQSQEIGALKSEVGELKEQIRDLMFFLETREKLGENEIENGTILGVSQSPKKDGKKKNKKK